MRPGRRSARFGTRRSGRRGRVRLPRGREGWRRHARPRYDHAHRGGSVRCPDRGGRAPRRRGGPVEGVSRAAAVTRRTRWFIRIDRGAPSRRATRLRLARPRKGGARPAARAVWRCDGARERAGPRGGGTAGGRARALPWSERARARRVGHDHCDLRRPATGPPSRLALRRARCRGSRRRRTPFASHRCGACSSPPRGGADRRGGPASQASRPPSSAPRPRREARPARLARSLSTLSACGARRR